MSNYYTDEKNILVLLSLLKADDLKKIIVSPGAPNISFVASIQQDSYFELYSAVDERSASYMACGLALESGEPVVLSCTGATASQNYLPGFIEAYYSKLPILAITSTQPTNRVGHLYPQVTDRSILPNDVFKENVELPIVLNDDDLWECEVKVNSAILSLSHHSKGPVFVNVPTSFSQNFNVKELPKYRVINRINQNDEFPELDNGKIAIFIGSHTHMSTELTESIDRFCENYNSVVFCDHTSGYNGKYKVLFALAASQQQLDCTKFAPDLIIHLGEISGDYFSDKILRKGIVWRVNEDGEIRDKFRKLLYIF